jgi:hypothetical protein
MDTPTDPTPREWFAEAALWYREQHQGCPHCRGQHCVFRSERFNRVEYYCSACDFSVCHDRNTGHYFAAPGTGCPVNVLADSF